MGKAVEILERNRSEIEALCARYGVSKLRIFGSALREDWDETCSDFDFLAEFGEPPPGINLFKQLFGFAVSLEKLLGRPVDVVDWKVARNPVFREAAEATAQDWYAA